MCAASSGLPGRPSRSFLSLRIPSLWPRSNPIEVGAVPEASDRSLRQVSRRVAGQSTAYALASAVGPITGVLLLPIYTRFLTPADFGLIALVEILSLVFTTVFSFGMTAMIPFYYVDYQAGSARRRGIGTVILTITMLNLVLMAAVVTMGRAPLALAMPEVPFWPLVPILAATALFDPYWFAAGSIYQIREQAARYSAWSTARLLLSIALKIWFVAVLRQGVYGYFVSSLIASLVTAVAVSPLLLRELEPAWDMGEVRRALALGGPTVPNNLFSYGFRVLDRLILERYVSTGEIGLYYIALRIADMMRLASDVFINAWRPVFFKEAAHRDFQSETTPAVMRLVSIGMIGAGLVVALFGREILFVLSTASFAGAARYVPLMVGAMVVKGIYSFPYLVVWYKKKTAWVPLLTAITMAFSVAANLAFTPRWGAFAAATVQLLSYLVVFSLMWLLARRLMPLRYAWREIGAAALAATVASAVGAPLPLAVSSVAVKVALLAGFGTVVVLSGGAGTRDLSLILGRAGMRDPLPHVP